MSDLHVADHDILKVFFYSFAHSQGRLIMQPDVLSFVASKWREKNLKINFSLREQMAQQVREFRPPKGHRAVDSQETKAQFAFWWENMWDIFAFHGLDEENLDYRPPSEEQLKMRSRKFSGEKAYSEGIFSSLRGDKMKSIADRIALNTPILGSQRIMVEHLVPNMISVETYFQGFPKYSEKIGRQRTDKGDDFESKIRLHCTTALDKVARKLSLNVYDEMYLDISNYLEKISTKSTLEGTDKSNYEAYKKLIEIYNKNHSENTVSVLHK